VSLILLGGTLITAAVRRLTTYAIAEDSMRPALRDGDWVLAVRSPRRVRRGDVVVVEHPHRPGFDLVKRVAAGPGEEGPGGVLGLEEVWVLGDDPEAGSIDSRRFGPVPLDRIRARVVVRYAPSPPAMIARR
jgi:type IV secretory pathway protease TraF